jgi:hypothetical protein
MEDNLFSKEQIEQIRKANSKIRANLDLDKYDPKKDTEDLKKLLKKAEKSRFSKDLDAFVEKDNPNPTKKSQATVKKGNPAAIDTMLRKAFRAIDLEKAREGKKGLMTPAEARERTDNARELNKAIQSSAKSGGSRGGSGIGGGGGMFPDTEKVPGKRPLKMKHGGMVKSSASKRADGIVKKGKTRGRMV